MYQAVEQVFDLLGRWFARGRPTRKKGSLSASGAVSGGRFYFLPSYLMISVFLTVRKGLPSNLL
jgi:hypothetical protein